MALSGVEAGGQPVPINKNYCTSSILVYCQSLAAYPRAEGGSKGILTPFSPQKKAGENKFPLQNYHGPCLSIWLYLGENDIKLHPSIAKLTAKRTCCQVKKQPLDISKCILGHLKFFGFWGPLKAPDLFFPPPSQDRKQREVSIAKLAISQNLPVAENNNQQIAQKVTMHVKPSQNC